MTMAVIAAREGLLKAALRRLTAERQEGGAHDAAEDEYADDLLAIGALHLVIAIATSDDPIDVPAHDWDLSVLSDGFHTIGELYEHRHALFCALVRLAPPLTVWRTWHHEDGSMFEGMFLAGIALPGGDISYHLPERYWDFLPDVRELDRAPHWDGYTPADVVNRLNAWRPWDAEQEGEDVLAETMMGGMGPDRTGAWTLNAHPPHDVVWAMAAALAESIGNAPNYQETGITFSPKPAGQARAEFALTVQRVDGKTPHQLRRAAEDRAAHFEVALQRILDTTGGQCETSTAGIGSCYRDGRTEDARYLADRCCDACIAHRALTDAEAS